LKRKLWQFNQSPVPKNTEIFNEQLEKILAVINSYYGQFKHAHTFNLRKSIYQKHFRILKSYFEPADQNFSYFRIKKNSMKTESLPGANEHNGNRWY